MKKLQCIYCTIALFCYLFFSSINTIYAQRAVPGGVQGVKAWFKTVYNPATVNYIWKDFSGNNIGLTYNGTPTLFSSTALNINFNPALYFNNSLVKELFIDAPLSQATCIGTFYSAPANYNTDQNLYLVNARKDEGFIMRSGEVVNSTPSQKGPLDYGKLLGTDFLYPNAESERNFNKYNERAMRTSTYYRYNYPAPYSIWGEDLNTNISIASVLSTTNTNTTSSYTGQPFTLTTANFAGYIPEFLVYDRVITPSERLRIESYLALKYGTTQFINSYVNSNGDTLWSMNKNAGFNNRITALGRDDADSLLQWRSTTTYEDSSSTTPSNYLAYNNDSYDPSFPYKPAAATHIDSATGRRLLSIEMDSTTTKKANQVLDDKEFLMWGDNDSSRVSMSVYQLPGLKIMPRKWKMVRTTAAPSKATLVELSAYATTNPDFKLTSAALPNRKTYLIIDSAGHDGTFSLQGLRYIQAKRFSTIRSKIIWDSIAWPGYSGGNIDYFTFGYTDGLFLQLDSINAACAYLNPDLPPIILNDAIKVKVKGAATAPYTYILTNITNNVIVSSGKFYTQDTVFTNLPVGKYSIKVTDVSQTPQTITGIINIIVDGCQPLPRPIPPPPPIIATIAPNPTVSGLFKLNVTLQNASNITVTISNLNGVVLQTIPINSGLLSYTYNGDLGPVAPGIYIVNITTASGYNYVQKLVRL